MSRHCRQRRSQRIYCELGAGPDRLQSVGRWMVGRPQRGALVYSALRGIVYSGSLGRCHSSADWRRLLLEARRKGVRRLLLVDVDGPILREIDLSGSYACPMRLDQMSRRFGDLCYENVFDEIFGRIGNKLQLPAESFEPSRVLLLIGSLGPGGSERQVAYTAAGLARTRAYDVYIGCNHIERHPDNLFRPMVEAAGAKIITAADQPPEYNTRAMALARQRLAPYDSISVQNIFHAILQYASMIREVRPGIVHTWTDYCNVFAGIAAELVGVPTLVLGGRSLAPDNYGALFHPYMRPGYLSILRQRNALFVHNSRAGAADYARWLDLPSDQFEVIHNGFDFPAESSVSARGVVRSAYGIPPGSLVVGSITRFSGGKATAVVSRHGAVNPRSQPASTLSCFWHGADARGDARLRRNVRTLQRRTTAWRHGGRLGGSRGNGCLCTDAPASRACPTC